MSYLVSGSSAYDALACPARVILPRGDETGEAAQRGTALHLYAQRMTEDPANQAKHLCEVPEEWRHTAEKMNIPLALDGITVVGCEVSFALDVLDKSCRMIGMNIDRNYDAALAAKGEKPLSEYEIPFTIDVMGEIDDVPVELDYKTGMSIGEVADHGQRRISAAGLMFYYRSDTAISRVAYVWEDGTIKSDGCEFTIMDADAICEELAEGIDRIRETRSAYAKGKVRLSVNPDRDKQCKYCPAMMSCPYWTNLAMAVVRDVKAGAITDELVTSNPSDLGKSLAQVKDVLKLFTSIEDKITAQIEKVGALPDGKGMEFYYQNRKGKKSFDAGAARGMLYTKLQESGLTDEECEAKIESLYKIGSPYTQLAKRKVTS